MLGSYTRGEVVALLSLSREQAIDLDAVPRSALAGLSGAQRTARTRAEDAEVMVIARWQDVQRAKKQVRRNKEGLAMAQLIAAGISERELGRLTGRDRLAVRRRWHASVDEIVEVLGGPADDSAIVSHVDLCIVCGAAPRARLAAVRRRVKGGWKIIEPERTAAVCAAHVKPALRSRIMGERAEAA